MILLLINIVFLSCVASAELEVGIDDSKLGTNIPMNLKFTDSEGNTKPLSEFIEKPVILSLVYYRCPGICNNLLNGVADLVDRVDMEPGKDYTVLSISFDFTETYDLAAAKKSTYMQLLQRKIDRKGWKFLVGDSVNVMNLTEAVGFKFVEDSLVEAKTDFLHVGALVAISPSGKITRYMMGTEFLPFDLKMAMIDASEGLEQPILNRVLAYCFKTTPDGRGYALDLTRIFGTIMIFGLGIFVTYLVRSGKKRNERIELASSENDDSEVKNG